MSEETSGKIAKNTLYLSGAFIGQKIFSFLYFTLIARFAGVEDTGVYVFALSFTTLFSIIVDLGLHPVLIREGSKDRASIPRLLGSIFALKIFLGGIAAFAAIFLIHFLGYPERTRELVYLATVIMLLDSFHLTLYGVLRAYQTLKYEAAGVVVGQFLTLLVGGTTLFFHLPIFFLLFAVMVNSIWNAIFSSIIVFKKLRVRLRLDFSKTTALSFLRLAFPFALAGLFAKVNFLDAVLVSTLLKSDSMVGWYSVAFKITFALQFIPLSFSASLYPAFSRFFVASKEKLAGVFERAFFFLTLVSVPVALGIAILADTIIPSVYGTAYAPSILPLQILIFALIPIFLNFPIGALLNACNRQSANTANMGVSVVLNIILNIVLISKFQIAGAAMAALASHSILFLLGWRLVPSVLKTPGHFKRVLVPFLKIVLSGIAMAAVVLFLKPFFHFLVLIPTGGVVFFAGLFTSKALGRGDVLDAIGLFKKKKTDVYEEDASLNA